MLFQDADIGDEVSYLPAGPSGLTQSVVITGKCRDFYYDRKFIGDIFMFTAPATPTAGPGTIFVNCHECTLVRKNSNTADTGNTSSGDCSCPIHLLMARGCQCGSFQKP